MVFFYINKRNKKVQVKDLNQLASKLKETKLRIGNLVSF